jgi:ribonucleoside-diphosphate reductase alpha chain
MGNEPYELFGGYADKFDIPAKHKRGKLVRKSQGKYSLIFDDQFEYESVDDIVSKLGSEFGWVTRLVSTALRHGTPIEFIVEQLGKEGLYMDFHRVLARVLKKYLADGQKVLTSNRCPFCDGTEFVYQESCPRCLNCGQSVKCS